MTSRLRCRGILHVLNFVVNASNYRDSTKSNTGTEKQVIVRIHVFVIEPLDYKQADLQYQTKLSDFVYCIGSSMFEYDRGIWPFSRRHRRSGYERSIYAAV